MARNDLQELRRSAVVSTAGPGALVDFRADGAAVSGLVAGLEEWDSSFPPAGLANPQKVFEPRLQKKLGVGGFRLPPVVDDTRKKDNPDNRRLVAVRFPDWLQCPSCDRIAPSRDWADEPGKAYRYCSTCSARSGSRRVFAIPVRFVMACRHGHIEDFPWHQWVGHRGDCRGGRRGLTLKSRRAGLAGLELGCPNCGATRNMEGIFSTRTWEGRKTCSGRRPWISGGVEACDQPPVALQRGASNLYFPVTQSALSIPPWDSGIEDAVGTFWVPLSNIPDPDQREQMIIMMGAAIEDVLRELRMSPRELAEAIERHLQGVETIETDDLRPAEYRQFRQGAPGDASDDFEIRSEPVPDNLTPWISCITRATRLREVRAITGFTRIEPPEDSEGPEISRLSGERLQWFPAIEVRGEGIFLALDEGRLAEWEIEPTVASRAAASDGLYRRDWFERHGEDSTPPMTITPRFVLCHTLAHALMRRLTLESGYASAALRERIYAATGPDPMAGLLIYTSTSDADGTLGGLERQGLAKRLRETLLASIREMQWCSSDPLCISDQMGAEASFSHAACHSCVLAPETSCETFNHYLDRAYLVGLPDEATVGFFHGLVAPS